MAMAVSDVKGKKLVDSIKELDGKPFRSLEFFPPRTAAAVDTLFQNITKLESAKPLFVDFTWGAGGSTSDLTIDLCKRVITEHHLNPNIHITCTGLDYNQLDIILERCKEAGIRNILALRGDPPQGSDTWIMPENGLTSALELIKYIRKKYGDYFCIGCAGYPEGHPNKMSIINNSHEINNMSPTELGRYSQSTEIITPSTTPSGTNHQTENGSETLPSVDPITTTTTLLCTDESFQQEINYLKEKVIAGAEFVITQMFFDVNVFKNFVQACRNNDIHVPILPGIMLIGNYGGFKRMTKLCKSRVPAELEKEVEALKNNEEGLRQFGVEFGVKVCTELLKFGVPGLHFYTLNSAEQTLKIIEQLNF